MRARLVCDLERETRAGFLDKDCVIADILLLAFAEGSERGGKLSEIGGSFIPLIGLVIPCQLCRPLVNRTSSNAVLSITRFTLAQSKVVKGNAQNTLSLLHQQMMDGVVCIAIHG